MIDDAIKALEGKETGFCPSCKNMWDMTTMCPVCYPPEKSFSEKVSSALTSLKVSIRMSVEDCLRWLFSLMPSKKFEPQTCRGCEQPVQFDDCHVNEHHRYDQSLHQWCADERGQPLHPWDKAARSAPPAPTKKKNRV